MAAATLLTSRARTDGKGTEPPGTFEHVVREHGPGLMRAALYLARRRDEAEDLVQDTFERALRKFSSLPRDTSYRAWLLRILNNRFIDQVRRQARRASLTPVVLSLSPADDVPRPEPDTPPPWAEVTSEQLDAAVMRLDEQFRAIYLLRVRHALSYEEIAARLGISKSTVGTRLHRARHQLRELLTAGRSDRYLVLLLARAPAHS